MLLHCRFFRKSNSGPSGYSTSTGFPTGRASHNLKLKLLSQIVAIDSIWQLPCAKPSSSDFSACICYTPFRMGTPFNRPIHFAFFGEWLGRRCSRFGRFGRLTKVTKHTLMQAFFIFFATNLGSSHWCLALLFRCTFPWLANSLKCHDKIKIVCLKSK